MSRSLTVGLCLAIAVVACRSAPREPSPRDCTGGDVLVVRNTLSEAVDVYAWARPTLAPKLIGIAEVGRTEMTPTDSVVRYQGRQSSGAWVRSDDRRLRFDIECRYQAH